MQPMADRAGNVFIGTQRELIAMAHAAQKTVVTVEKIHDGDLLRDPLLAAGTLPGFYVEAVAVEPRGAWPLPLPDHYGIDAAHMAEYARLAATPEGFAQYLDRYVYEKARVIASASCPACAGRPRLSAAKTWTAGTSRP